MSDYLFAFVLMAAGQPFAAIMLLLIYAIVGD